MHLREIKKIVDSQAATDGAGVKINRLTGWSTELKMDPFLMLDEISSDSKDDFVAGFPPHPHRGFETITYMLKGGFSHQDSMGNSGEITAGGAQWMSAASGVIHSEMPVAEANEIHGFQFWLNLPASEKMQVPQYRDIQQGEVIGVNCQAARIRLIAGTVGLQGKQIQGTVTGKTTRPLLADVTFSVSGALTLELDAELNTQFYVYRGRVAVAGREVMTGQLASLGDGDRLTLDARKHTGLLLFGGRPLNEPVAHYGPYVMNTREEIEQALNDYRSGTLVKASANLL